MERLPSPQLWHEGINQAADAVVLSSDNKVLLIKRHSGDWALPGGFADPGEPTEHSARREALEETGLAISTTGIQCYSGPVDDPRNSEDRWIESDAYYYLVADTADVAGQDDAQDARWFELYNLPEKLYGSHGVMISNALALKETSD